MLLVMSGIGSEGWKKMMVVKTWMIWVRYNGYTKLHTIYGLDIQRVTMLLDMSEIEFPDWKQMMSVVEILMTWMIWFICNGHTIICMQSMNWILNISCFWSVLCTAATFY